MTHARRTSPLGPLELARALARWPVESQLGSRRNALLASTILTEVTKEWRDVEDYLAGLYAPVSAEVAGRDAAPTAWPQQRSAI